MTYKEIILSNYPDVIVTTVTEINYGVNLDKIYNHSKKYISFIKLLNAIGTGKKTNLIRCSPVDIEKEIQNKYGNSTIKAVDVLINNLSFYQDEVDIDRLDKVSDDPVIVVDKDDKLTLLNGYHRTVIRLLNLQENISAYIYKL